MKSHELEVMNHMLEEKLFTKLSVTETELLEKNHELKAWLAKLEEKDSDLKAMHKEFGARLAALESTLAAAQ